MTSLTLNGKGLRAITLHRLFNDAFSVKTIKRRMERWRMMI
jgi:hypothetical protein